MLGWVNEENEPLLNPPNKSAKRAWQPTDMLVTLRLAKHSALLRRAKSITARQANAEGIAMEAEGTSALAAAPPLSPEM